MLRTHSAKSLLVPLSRIFSQREDMHDFLDAYDRQLSDFTKDSSKLTWQEELEMIRGLRFQMDDPELGYRLGRSYGESNQGMLGKAMAACGTLREALIECNRFLDLTFAFFRFDLAFSADYAYMSFAPEDEFGDLFALLRDREMAAIWRLLKTITEGELSLARVELSEQSEADHEFVRRYWPCEVVFGAEKDRFVFHSTTINEPLPGSDPGLCQDFLKTCQEYKQRLSAQHSMRAVLLGMISTAENTCLTLEEAAEVLNISGRTLRRRLAEEGTRYRELLDEVRFELSRRYLTESDLSHDQIAIKVGYQSTTNFNHAFRRWANISPGRFRRHSGSE